MSLRVFCSFAAIVCAAGVSTSACDKCAQPIASPFGGPTGYSNYQSPVISLGTSQFSPLDTPQFGVTGSGQFGSPYHSQCSDPNCRSCPQAGYGGLTPLSGGGCNGQCGSNCTHPGGFCPDGACYGGNCGCAGGNCGCAGGFLPNVGAAAQPFTTQAGRCPVDGRPLGQFGPPHSVIVNGAIVHVCSGDCANRMRGYGAGAPWQPASFAPTPTFGPLPTLR